MSVFRALINNLVKESFYEKRKKKFDRVFFFFLFIKVMLKLS